MTGRRQDAIWQHFIKIKDDNRRPLRAKCKHCQKEMCSLVARMKTHTFKCNILNKDKSFDQFDEGAKENDPPILNESLNNNIETVSASSDTSTEFDLPNKRSKTGLFKTVPQTQSSSCSASTSSTSLSTIPLNSGISGTNLNSFIMRTTNLEKKKLIYK